MIPSTGSFKFPVSSGTVSEVRTVFNSTPPHPSDWPDLSCSAVKAVTAAQLSMAADGVYSVTLDEAIEAMRLTAADMSVKYKETSLSVSRTSCEVNLYCVDREIDCSRF